MPERVGNGTAATGARLLLLGPFAFQLPQLGGVSISSKKNRALLALLALAPGRRMTRERLCGYLWGDRGDEQARASLRQSLATLRRELDEAGVPVLLTKDDGVSLHGESLVIDALDLLRPLSQSSELRDAASLWRGPFLADTELNEPEFRSWLATERQRLLDRSIAVHQSLAERQESDAIEWARRLVALDPLREASHCTLMMALARAGDRVQAIRQFEICRDTLKHELDVEPSGATVALVKAISEGHHAAPAPLPMAAGANRSGTRLPTLAVVPFWGLSEERSQQHLADGLAEDLITDLSKIAGLSVVVADSVLRFSGEKVEPHKAAKLLKVRHIVTGSLRRVQESLRVNVQLIDTETGQVKWAERFDRRQDELHDIQGGIVQSVAIALTGETPQVERYRPHSIEAHDLVMRGRREFRHSDEAGTKAMGMFKRAIEIDPHYSEAYRWLALAQCLSWFAFGAPEYPVRTLALENARKAISIDPEDSAAHAVHGFLLIYEHRWEEADAALQQALALNPHDPEAWISLAELRMFEGKTSEAVECANRALERNPRPLGSVYWILGEAQFADGDLESAVVTLRREETYSSPSRRHLAAALALLGRHEEAAAEARLFMADNPHFRISEWVAAMAFRDLAMQQKFVNAYRLAGLPD